MSKRLSALLARSRQSMNGRALVATTFLAQPFEAHREGLRLARQEQAPSKRGTLEKAEAITGRTLCTAALTTLANDETGELESVVILGH